MVQFVIGEVLQGPPELSVNSTERVNTVACLSDSAGHSEYWCAQLDTPVQHRLDTGIDVGAYPPELVGEDPSGPYLWVYFLVLRARNGRQFRPGAYRLAVDVAYVMDLSLSQDTIFDPAKVHWVAVAEITVAAEPAGDSPNPQRASAPTGVSPDAATQVAAADQDFAEPGAAAGASPAVTSFGGAVGTTTPQQDATAAWVSRPADDQRPTADTGGRPPWGTPTRGASSGSWAPTSGYPPQPPPSRPVPAEPHPGAAPVMLNPKQFRQQLDAILAALASLAGQKRLRSDTPSAVELKPGQPPPEHVPCYSIEPGRLHYRTQDPSQGWVWRTTSDPDELVYWIVDDVARSLAWSWAQRSPSFSTMPVRQVQETLAMPYWCLLVQSLNPQWGQRTHRGVQALLRAAATPQQR